MRYALEFGQPWALGAALLVVPIVLLAVRNLASLHRWRRVTAIVIRSIVVLLLACLLAEPRLAQIDEKVTLITVVDRSRSVPEAMRDGGLSFLEEACGYKEKEDRLAVINVAEAAVIEKLPSTNMEIRRREPSLLGEQSNLAAGIQMGMAIAPAETATRFLLVSDGNETAGDLREAVRVAAANGIPVDVLPVRYDYPREVMFKRLDAPSTARAGETVGLRFVMRSTAAARGRLHLALNGQAVDLDPETAGVAAALELRPGTNVKSISFPVGPRGLYEYEASFVPDGPDQDTLTENNQASSMTLVAGPGEVLVLDGEGQAGARLVTTLSAAGIAVRHGSAGDLPHRLAELVNVDAVILVDTPNDRFTFAQQELLCAYVKELGGGLIMVGGPHAFGAGGWIGSPVAEILPVNLDPPQKKELPKGALVLIMHSCEMPDGNYWGVQIALAAVNTLSRLDLVGVMSYGWQTAGFWDYPLQEVGDKLELCRAMNMSQGDMPDFGAPLQAAYQALVSCQAGQKHIIMISDGDPSDPSDALLAQMAQAGITCTGVAINPHSAADVQSLQRIAMKTGGRFYNPQNANALPQIFIKEARTVKRALIQEMTFHPTITGGPSEILRGLTGGLPQLNGYVITAPKGGLAELLLTGPKDDPILASCQAGVGRCVAFTGSVDSRWAGSWLTWGGFPRFWEQVVRWCAKSAQGTDCEVFTDVEARAIAVTVEAAERDGELIDLGQIAARIVGPDMQSHDLNLLRVGPGQYRAAFTARGSGSYLVNVRYQKPGGGVGMVQSVANVPYAPEFSALSDNLMMLKELAELSGGRVLSGEPEDVELFSRAGLKFPRTPLPLTRPLVIAWLVLFLLDVAVRRVVIDLRALGAYLRKLLPSRAAESDTRLDRLRSRAAVVRKRLVPGERAPEPSKRYEAPTGAADVLPDEAEQAPTAPAPEEKQPPRKETARPDAGQKSIDRLLEAKRRKGKTRKDDRHDG